MSNILAVGSMAFDTLETPFGRAEKILGGSVNYFSLSASHFTPVRCVSVVGEDFPESHLELLKSRNIDISGIEKAKGKTFHWSGSYSFNLNEASTLSTELNVFETFDPKLPENFKDSEFLFLGNIAPQIQKKVLSLTKKPKFVALDTMNFWIEGQRKALEEVLAPVDALIINEGEVRQLSKEQNIVKAAEYVRRLGPKTIVIKRGEYGALLFHENKFFSIPGLPLALVKDPTGAGDTFAGGFMGYLASQANATLDMKTLRKAVVYGCVMASFTVQDFGFGELLKVNPDRINERFQEFIHLTQFDLATA